MSTDLQVFCDACKTGQMSTAQGILSLEPAESRSEFVNAFDKGGWTPLLGAAGNGHLKVIELLLREGADINVGHRIDGWTALHLATQQASIAAVQLLLDEGANVALTNNAGDTALHTATQGGSNQAPAIVHMLLQAGANPNAMSGVSGESPVHVAARSFSTNILRMLIRCKGSVEQVDRMGATPLLTALEARCVHGAHFLLHHCASLDVRDIVHGKTPIQRARALGFADMATLFEEIAAQRSEQKQLAQLIVAKVRPQQAVDIPSFLWRRIFGGGSENEQRGAFLPIRQSWLRQSDRGGAEPSRATRIAQAIEREVETNVRNLRGMIERRVMVKWADGRWYRGRITDFDVKSMQSRVLYDDGDSKRYYIPGKKQFKLLALEDEAARAPNTHWESVEIALMSPGSDTVAQMYH